MSISSRTPEGALQHCLVCGKPAVLEPSPSSFDAPCPNCGQLLWFSEGFVSLAHTELQTARSREGHPEQSSDNLQISHTASWPCVLIDLSAFNETDKQFLIKLLHLNSLRTGKFIYRLPSYTPVVIYELLLLIDLERLSAVVGSLEESLARFRKFKKYVENLKPRDLRIIELRLQGRTIGDIDAEFKSRDGKDQEAYPAVAQATIRRVLRNSKARIEELLLA